MFDIRFIWFSGLVIVLGAIVFDIVDQLLFSGNSLREIGLLYTHGIFKFLPVFASLFILGFTDHFNIYFPHSVQITLIGVLFGFLFLMVNFYNNITILQRLVTIISPPTRKIYQGIPLIAYLLHPTVIARNKEYIYHIRDSSKSIFLFFNDNDSVHRFITKDVEQDLALNGSMNDTTSNCYICGDEGTNIYSGMCIGYTPSYSTLSYEYGDPKPENGSKIIVKLCIECHHEIKRDLMNSSASNNDELLLNSL